ncbi:MAG: PEGA domain-containing protein [Treponema sp.]|nr:PEGA domain-containing protein [Treponema sp.]
MKRSVFGNKRYIAAALIVLLPILLGAFAFAKQDTAETGQDETWKIESAEPEETSLIENGTRIQLRTEKPGEKVFINNNYQGKTPLTIKNLVPGTYRLRIGEEEFEIEVKSNHFDRYFFLSGKNL